MWRSKARMIQQTVENQGIVYIGLRSWNPEQPEELKQKPVEAEFIWKECIVFTHFPMKLSCSDWMESLTSASWEAGRDKIMQMAEGVLEMIAVFLGWAFSHQGLQTKPIL